MMVVIFCDNIFLKKAKVLSDIGPLIPDSDT